MTTPTQDDEPIEVEVRVRSTRRRRSEPPPVPVPSGPNVRNWMIYAAIGTGITALMLDGYLGHRPRRPELPDLSEATDVRSTLSPANDSLQVVVSWDLTLSDPAGKPDSIQVKVVSDLPKNTLLAMQPATELADTAYLPAPPPGQTLAGTSCVAAKHPGSPLTESCTPWQYVKPSATSTAAAPGVVPNQIFIQPAGLQVDPDIGGRCAHWQATHPGDPVWRTVNKSAIPECTGPNGKPTVAQFCAFAVLPDGRRIKTANTANNRYCDELFVEWARERYS